VPAVVRRMAELLAICTTVPHANHQKNKYNVFVIETLIYDLDLNAIFLIESSSSFLYACLLIFIRLYIYC
jgi:hypothetical protein